MRRRASLTMLMGLVALVAIGLAMMKVANEPLARGVILLAFVSLLGATLGSLVRRRDRPTWIGTAIFGWGYCLLVVATSFMDVRSGHHGNSAEVWRVDDLAESLADQLHPDFPTPVEPFPRTATAFDPKTKLRSEAIGDRIVSMTPAEAKARTDYEDQMAQQRERAEEMFSAFVIGMTIQGVGFALVGGAAGNVLSDRSTTASVPPGSGPSTLPG